MNTPLILHTAPSGDGLDLPLGLSGYPTTIEGKPCYYRRKEIIRAGDWHHRGTRTPFSVTRGRLDDWVASFNRRIANGIRPFVPDHHTEEPKAGENHGYVVGLNREGDSLYADMQIIGDESLALAAKNDVSVYIKAEGVDAKGNAYGEHLQHLALTPNPKQPHLGPFVTIAASAGGSPADVPIYTLSAATSERSTLMKPETLKKLREKFKLDDTVSDELVAEKAAELALAPIVDKTPEVTALSADVARLTQERDDAKSATLALSAAQPSTPDAVTLAMYGENIAAKREAAIRSGAVSEAQAKLFDTLVSDSAGNPTPLALSASAGNRPLAFALWDAVAKLADGADGAIRTGHAVTRGVTTAIPALSAGETQTPDQVRAAVDAELARTELGRRQLAARKAS